MSSRVAGSCVASALASSALFRLLLAIMFLAVLPAQASEDEKRLIEDLFDKQGYNPLIRPAPNDTTNLNVYLELALIQVIRIIWEDKQLAWDPLAYGGIYGIMIPAEKVWRPDIVLFNNADGKYTVSYEPNVVMRQDGSMMWIPISIYKSSCTIDVEFFPFDEQFCKMELGSWTFNSNQITISYYVESKKNADLTDYEDSGTWDIIECPGFIKDVNVTNTTQTSRLIYNLRLRRKTLFYLVTLIIPCVLISFLSVGIFYLPSDAGEKMTMCISVLLALVVFLLLVSKLMPPTSKTVPLISKYLLFTFVMNIFTIVITVVIINWNFRTPRTHRMAGWVRVVFLNYLPRCLFMMRPQHNARCSGGGATYTRRVSLFGAQSPSRTTPPPVGGLYGTASKPSNGDHEMTNVNVPATQHERRQLFQASRHNRHVTVTSADHPDNSADDTEDETLSPEIHQAVEAVRFIAAHLKNEEDYSEILDDWRYIASVIDRLQLYIFLAITLLGTIKILASAPNIFQNIDQGEVKKLILNANERGQHFFVKDYFKAM